MSNFYAPRANSGTLSFTTSEIKTEPPYDENFNCLSADTLRKVVEYLRVLERTEAALNEEGMYVWLNSPIMVQGEGYRIGWLKPVDDFWVFVPDVKEDQQFHEGGPV